MGCGNSSGKKGTTSLRADPDGDNKEFLEIIKFLRGTLIFEGLPQGDFPIIAAACTTHVYKVGKTIKKHGPEGRDFYVVRRGEAKLEAKRVKGTETDGDPSVEDATEGIVLEQLPERTTDESMSTTILRSKDFFGERALMWNEVWDFTFVALQELELIVLSHDTIQQLGLTKKLLITKRRPIRRSMIDYSGGKKALRQKNAKEVKRIEAALKSCKGLSSFFSTNPNMIAGLAAVAWRQGYNKGEIVVNLEEESPERLFIVDTGGLALTLREKELPGKTATNMVKPGQCYGDQVLIYENDYTDNAIAMDGTVVWVIEQSDLVEATRDIGEVHLDKLSKILDCVPLLNQLLSADKLELAKVLNEVTVKEGEKICSEGDQDGQLTILLNGEVRVMQNNKEVAKFSAVTDSTVKEKQPKPFGDASLRKGVPHSNTIVVVSETADILVLTRTNLEAILGPLSETDLSGQKRLSRTSAIVRVSARGDDTTAYVSRASRLPSQFDDSLIRKARHEILMSDMKVLFPLGRGGYGKVELCEHSKSKKLYALKTVHKARVSSSAVARAQILNEKYILEMLESKFVIKLFRTDKTATDLLFVMEPALGGELYVIYKMNKLFGRKTHTRYYAACVISAFEHMHERFIVYRDLKPENVLLDEHGHAKLVDMGLAKFVVGKTYTLCGTAVYLAPETIAGSGYTHAIDWWQVGIFVWELLSGHPPFLAASAGEARYWLLCQKKLTDIETSGMVWPKSFPANCDKEKDFLKHMLLHEPTRRIPMKTNGGALLRALPLFSDFSFEKLAAGQLKPPYVPPVWDRNSGKSPLHFYPDGPAKTLPPYVDDGSGWDDEF